MHIRWWGRRFLVPEEEAIMSYRSFVREVARRAEVSDLALVELSVTDTLAALGQRLCDIDAQAVAAQLPPSLADPHLSAVLEDRGRTADLTTAGDGRLGRATCRLLSEVVRGEARAHLRMQPLNALFTTSA